MIIPRPLLQDPSNHQDAAPTRCWLLAAGCWPVLGASGFDFAAIPGPA